MIYFFLGFGTTPLIYPFVVTSDYQNDIRETCEILKFKIKNPSWWTKFVIGGLLQKTKSPPPLLIKFPDGITLHKPEGSRPKFIGSLKIGHRQQRIKFWPLDQYTARYELVNNIFSFSQKM